MKDEIIISAIAAMDNNRAIGSGNKLPWCVPVDMRFFLDTTLGKPVIMGRKTFESLGKALPKRANIVMTRQSGFVAPGCSVDHTIEGAIHAAKTDARKSGVKEIFVIGGEEIYRLALPQTSRIYLTYIDTVVKDPDAFFPELESSGWKMVSERMHFKDADNPFDCRFVVYERV